MHPRRVSVRGTPRCSQPLLCAALTLYSTWPCAQVSPAYQPALSLSYRLSAPPAEPAEPAEPLLLRLSLGLTAFEDLPVRQSEPLPLRLALAVATRAPGTPETARGPLAGLDSPPLQPGFYAIRVNGQDHGVARLLRTRDGRWLARRADLEEWRLQIPTVNPVLFGGEEHYALDAFEGFTYRFDESLQALELAIAPRQFAETIVQATPAQFATPRAPGVGGFLNYDLFVNATSDSTRLSGVLEGAVFNRFGVGVSSFIVQNGGGGAESRLVRLDTTWRRDFPRDTRTLVVGDAIGSSGVWGRPVRFGGVRYGTNFATNPGFVTLPLPGFRGEAALPATTDLYVDGVLRQSSSVPPGPFRINNVPVVTGQGEVRLVVRDLLGREQVVSLPYYTSSQLLREGLREDSNEIGVVRNNFGIRSNDYGRFVSAFQRRQGFSDRFTGEARAELLRDQQTVGAGGSVAAPSIGVFTGGTAVSHGPIGNGGLLFTAFERQVRRGVSFGVRSQWTSARFTQLGMQPDQRAPVRLMSGNVGFQPGGYGSFGLAYVREDNRDRASAEIVSASYSVNVGKSTALIVFAFKPLHGEGTHAVGITLSMGFGERSSASISYTAQPDANQALFQVQQNLPPGSGTGYRVLAGLGAAGAREEVGFAWQTETGTYGVEAGRADHRTGIRGSATGGVAVVDGRPFLARALTDSFGVAHVPGFANVGVYLNNQIVARTDAQGYAMVPRLLPYQPNAVRIDTGDLPLDAQIDAVQIDAVPYYRSGLLLKFPIQRANGALLTIVLEDGTPLPVGSVVNVAGAAEQFPVAQRGEAYVTGLTGKNRLRATWNDQTCEFSVELDQGHGPLPRIGPIRCEGVKP